MSIRKIPVFFCVIHLLLVVSSSEETESRKDVGSDAGTVKSRRKTPAKDTEDTVVVQEEISLNSFLHKFENQMDPRAGIGDKSMKHSLKEMLYDLKHPYNNRYSNEYTRLSRMCRHLLTNTHVTNRVRRTAGRLPRLVQEIGPVCRDFQKDQNQETMERLVDLDAEIMKEVICLERGVPVGPGSSCQSHFRVGRSVLMEDEASVLSDDIDLPDVAEINNFNTHINEYCHKRYSYEPERIRRSTHAATDFTADTLDYLNCVCDNKTTCGHLAQKSALSFGKDIGEVLAQELTDALEEGHRKEQETETEIRGQEEHLLAPGNYTHEEALNRAQTFKDRSSHHRVKRFERPDVFDIPLKEFGKHVGCNIIIHKDIPVQTFTCVFFKVVAIELTFDWTNGLPWIELVIKLCLPVVSDVLDMIGKNFKPLASLLSMFDIEAGCFVIAKAYVDFYRGIFEIYSNVPQLSLLVIRAKIRSSFYIRFDPSRPTDNEEERKELNVYGYRQFMTLQVTFRVEYFEIWKLWWGSWQCIYCTTWVDNKWPLGDDQSPLVKGTDPLPPPDFRLADSQVQGTGRIEVKTTGEWGTVCDDGWDIVEGDMACQHLGFKGYMWLWNDTTPGTGDVLIGGLNCVGTEEDLSKCPKTKDEGNTGCEHTEDVGIQCLTEDAVCAEPLLEVYDIGADQLSHSSGTLDDELILFSGGGWVAGSAGEEWLMIDLWFSHQISGVRTQGHAVQAAWTTEFRIEFSKDGTEWTSRQDNAGNEIMYVGNIDQNSIRSNFWYPSVPARMLKLIAVKFEGKPAFRLEVHGCTGSDGIQEFADAFQSSTMFGGFAKLALDKSTNNNFKVGKSCTHTMEEINPWWAMDFGREMLLEGLLILNRGDCCGHRLSNFQVDVGNKLSSVHGVYGEMCFHYPGKFETNQKKIIRCQGTPRGRFMQVKKRGYGILTLCQVLIWAAPTKPTCDFVGEKADCGHSSQVDCEAAGCCWQSGGSPQCFTFRTDVKEKPEDCTESLYNEDPTTKVSTSSHITEGGDYSSLRSRLGTMLSPDGANNGANYEHGGWCAAMNDKHQYIQVEFSEVWTIRKVITQGADASEDFVTKYMLYYSIDGIYWAINGGILVGNTDVSTHAVNEFQRFSAKYIRINPVEWHGRICMRFDVLGCKLCEVSLVQRAPVVFFSSSSVLNDDLANAADRARLESQSGGTPYVDGGWTSGGNGVNEYIQVDFIGLRTISKVVTQGASDKQQWVKRYSVEYSTDGNTYTAAGEYQGNVDNQGKVSNDLVKPIRALSVRLKVIEYHGKATLRFDLLGCDPKVEIGIVEAAKENGITEGVKPAFFFVDERVSFSDAEARCKAHNARVATSADFTSALEGGLEVCSPGWISDGTVKQPQQHYTGDDRCGEAGDNDLGKANPDKLFGVFCAKPGGFVFIRELPGVSGDCPTSTYMRTCQTLGGRLMLDVDGEAVVSDGYENCKVARSHSFMDFYDEAKIDFCGAKMTMNIASDCQSYAYCVMTALNSGIAPTALLPFRYVASGTMVFNAFTRAGGDYDGYDHVDESSKDESRLFTPVVNNHQYIFGSVLGGTLDKIGAAIIGEEPKDSGVLCPPENFELVAKEADVGFYRAVCPEGFVSLGDVVIPNNLKDDPTYTVNSQFRCIRLDFVKQCTFTNWVVLNTPTHSLYQLWPNRVNMDLTARFFRVGTFFEGPPPETAFCLKRSHAVNTDPRLYSQFGEKVLEVKLMLTGAKKAIPAVQTDGVSFFKPELEPGQYLLGMVAVLGRVDTYENKIFVATEQREQDILMAPLSFDRSYKTSPGFTAFTPRCESGYTAVGHVAVPLDEEPDEETKKAFRCVSQEFMKDAATTKWLEGMDGYVLLTSLEHKMDFFQQVPSSRTFKPDKFMIV